MERRSVSTGTIWERRYSYCRAVRYGDRIMVSGTTAAEPDGEVSVQRRFDAAISMQLNNFL